ASTPFDFHAWAPVRFLNCRAIGFLPHRIGLAAPPATPWSSLRRIMKSEQRARRRGSLLRRAERENSPGCAFHRAPTVALRKKNHHARVAAAPYQRRSDRLRGKPFDEETDSTSGGRALADGSERDGPERAHRLPGLRLGDRRIPAQQYRRRAEHRRGGRRHRF